MKLFIFMQRLCLDLERQSMAGISLGISEERINRTAVALWDEYYDFTTFFEASGEFDSKGGK